MLAHKYRELLSKDELKDFSMEKFRRLRQTRPDQTVSMETPLTEKLNLGDTMAGGEDPSAVAAVSEAIKKLTGAQAKNFQKLVDGLDVHPQEKARILDLLQSVRTPKPIRGGGEAPLQAGAFSPFQVLNTRYGTGPTLKQTLSTKKGQNRWGGNPEPGKTMMKPISPETMVNRSGAYMYGDDPVTGLSGMRETLPPGIRGNADVPDLIMMLINGIANTGRN
jgi:hypothetical protein